MSPLMRSHCYLVATLKGQPVVHGRQLQTLPQISSFMSVPYATDNDITTNGSKAANHLNLKNLRLKQRSTKRRYEDVPLSTCRAHAKLAAADTDEVSTKTLVFALNRTSSKIPGS